MQNSRDITYPSITICTKQSGVDPEFFENSCLPCEYERETNLSSMFAWMLYHYVNEEG